ncbi:MAG TPA: iron ABC transporter ATP-binding protein [Selenomonas sp.]|nr:ABC transporter ATP-binding protein [Selenomonadaceae bacterium]HCB93990.1 iron ABC transporter ATP-binding protein [Selenomonas sp.]
MKLEAKDISVTISGKPILTHIGLTFTEGKRTAIIGPNGAGKSTLLRVLASLNTDYEGDVLLGGENIRDMGRKSVARRLAILPQSMQAPPDTTVRRLVDYGRFPYRGVFTSSNPKEDREAVEWALSVTHLEHMADRQVISLSGGERQRAWIAMALAQRPEILLLDEPTTYLDIAHQLEVMQIIRQVNELYGMTVIMVLHDINHALQYADEIVVIKDHGIYAQGVPRHVLTVDMLAKVFGVRADIFTNSQGISVLSPIEIVRK